MVCHRIGAGLDLKAAQTASPGPRTILCFRPDYGGGTINAQKEDYK
jgi:hypothetical protein